MTTPMDTPHHHLVTFTLSGSPRCWGLRLAKHHTHHDATLTKVARVHPYGLAFSAGVRDGDLIESINGSSSDLLHLLSDLSVTSLRITVRRSAASSLEASTAVTDQQLPVTTAAVVAKETEEEEECGAGEEVESSSLVREVLSTLSEGHDDHTCPEPVWVPPSQEPSPAPKRKFKHVQPPQNYSPANTAATSSSAATGGVSSSSPAPPAAGGISSSSPTAAAAAAGENLLLLQLASDKSPEDNSSSAVLLPRYVSPTVTLLKKAREGSLPRGASYLLQDSPVDSQKKQQQRSSVSIPAQLQKTKEVVPRSEQHDWYKQMYEHIHVEKNSTSRVNTPVNQAPRQLATIKFSPGRIEDYNPNAVGTPSKKTPKAIPPELRRHWALEDSSSSSAVPFTKTPQDPSADPPRPLTPSEQRHLYVEIQKGGDVPIHGLRMVNTKQDSSTANNVVHQRRMRSVSPVAAATTSRKTSPVGKTLLLTRSSSSSLIPRYRKNSPVRTIEEIKIQLSDSSGANKKKKSILQQPVKPQRSKKKVTTTVKLKGLNDETTPPPPIPPAPAPSSSSAVKPTKTSLLRESLLKTSSPASAAAAAAATPSTIRRSLSQQTLRDYAEYIISLRHSSSKSLRFRRLHSLYSSLERLNNLSRSAQETFTLTKLSAAKSLDFNDWWRWRNRLRIDKEIQDILQELLRAQQDKEFFFSGRDVVKWSPDSHLRFKKFNVKEIQDILSRKNIIPPASNKDIYRSMYRGTSVRESCLNLEVLNEVLLKNSAVKRSNTFCCSSPSLVTTRPRGFTLSSDRYDPGKISSNNKSVPEEDEERRRKLFSGLICEELKLRGVVRVTNTGILRSHHQPMYGLYSFDLKERTRRLQQQKDHTNFNKSSPARREILPDNKKIQQQQQQLHSVETRSRRPLYQPSGTPNVLQPMLFHHQQQHSSSSPGGTRTTTTSVRLLDSRVFVNFDPSLHQPKFRYTPTRDSNTSTGRGKRTMVHIHYASPVILEEKEYVAEEDLRRIQQQQMQHFYAQQRKLKQLKEIQDTQNRRHQDNFVPSQKSPIPLNRYDEDDVVNNSDDDDEDDYDFYGGSRNRNNHPSPRSTTTAGNGFQPFRARALYDFKALSQRELSLVKGEVLEVLRRLDSNWFEGQSSRNKIGIFPTTYVTALDDRSCSPPRRVTSPITTATTSLKTAVVEYDFHPSTSSSFELRLSKGDKVSILRRVDRNWFEGKVGRRRGIFPASYVSIIEDKKQKHSYVPNSFQLQQQSLEDDNDKNGCSRKRFRVLYGYAPLHADELELRENDVVEVMEMCDDGWFVGTNLRSHKFGTFPGNYVKH